MASVWPSANASVPPTTVPPSRFQVPVAALNVNVFRVGQCPHQVHRAAVRVKLVNTAGVIVPPTFNVPPLTLITPEPMW